MKKSVVALALLVSNSAMAGVIYEVTGRTEASWKDMVEQHALAAIELLMRLVA